MAAVTRLGLHGGPRAPYAGFAPAAATCALSGTVTTATEDDIVSGGRTIVLTLTNDTWVAAGPGFELIRPAIINGLNSAQAEAFGWNAEVRDKEVGTAVVRTSDTVVTITLTAAPAYDITADETITATVPSAALVTSGSAVVATPTFAVTFVAEEVVPPPSAGGGSGAGERRRPPFTGSGFFDDIEPFVEPETETESETAEVEALAPPVESDGSILDIGRERQIDEVARAREAKRAREVRAENLVRQRLAEAERSEAEAAERRMLAFLEAEATQRRIAEEGEQIIAAYLDFEQQLRDLVLAHVRERQGRLAVRSLEVALRGAVTDAITIASEIRGR